MRFVSAELKHRPTKVPRFVVEVKTENGTRAWVLPGGSVMWKEDQSTFLMEISNGEAVVKCATRLLRAAFASDGEDLADATGALEGAVGSEMGPRAVLCSSKYPTLTNPLKEAQEAPQ